MSEIERPTPVLSVTARCATDHVDPTIADALAALRETANRMQLAVVATPLRVTHADHHVVEVCLPVSALPDADPPAPIAAEVLTPGTVVEELPLQ